MHERLARSGDGALLFHYPEYDSLPAGDRDAIDALVSTVRVAAGETVFRRGDPGDAMFVVKSGRFRVTGATPSGAEVTLGEIGPRDWAGEMAVLTGQPRSATLTAVTDGELVRLLRSGFDELARLYPEVASRLTAEIGPRLRRTQLLRVWEELFGITDPAAFRELEDGRRVAARERRRGPHPAGGGERRDVRRRHRAFPDRREGSGRRRGRRSGDRRLQHARRAGAPERKCLARPPSSRSATAR